MLSTFRGDGNRSTKPSLFFQQTLPPGTKLRSADSVRKRGIPPSPAELDALFSREFYLPYVDGAAWPGLETRARALVDTYLREWDDELHRVWEVERPFELHLTEGNVVGRADVILDREGGVAGDRRPRRLQDPQGARGRRGHRPPAQGVHRRRPGRGLRAARRVPARPHRAEGQRPAPSGRGR